MRRIGPVLLGCLVLAGCGSSNSSSAFQSPTTANPALPPTTSASASTDNPHRKHARPDGITGFGATVPAWNANHTRDPKYSGPVYNPDPAAPSGDDYDAVMFENDRVLGYDMRFANEPISEARAKVAAELPPDAKVVTFEVQGSVCAFELLSSAKLGKSLGTKAIGDPTGAVLVEYGSGAADDSYDSDSVNEALFSLGATTPSQIPGC